MEDKRKSTAPDASAGDFHPLLILRDLARHLWLVIALTVLCSAAMGVYSWRSYVPRYEASVTFTVNVRDAMQSSISSYNSAAADQMAKTFPYILTSGLLSDRVKEDLGVEVLPAISASAEPDTNIFVLSVSGNDPQQCYDVLQSVIRNYPEVAEFVVGATEFVVVDETGVPETPSNSRNWISSAKRGAVIGLAVGVVWAFLYGLSRSTVNGREDLQRYTNARYIGSLPDLGVKKRSNAKNSIPQQRRSLRHIHDSIALRGYPSASIPRHRLMNISVFRSSGLRLPRRITVSKSVSRTLCPSQTLRASAMTAHSAGG